MAWMLDTNACIRYLNGRSASLLNRVGAVAAAQSRVCSVVKAELAFGAVRSADPAKALATQQTFLSRFVSLPFDDRCVEAYAAIRSSPPVVRQPIGPNDVLIAAIAVTHDLALVTHNVSEFCAYRVSSGKTGSPHRGGVPSRALSARRRRGTGGTGMTDDSDLPDDDSAADPLDPETPADRWEQVCAEGVAAYRAGRLDEAEQHLLTAAAIAESNRLPGGRVAATLYDLGRLYADRGRFPEAADAHQRAPALREQEFGPGHPAVGDSLMHLAWSLWRLGRPNEAERLLRRARPIVEAARGADSPEAGDLLTNLALLVAHNGGEDDEEEESLLRLACGTRSAALGPDAPEVAGALNNLANFHARRREYDQAAALHERARAVREKALAPTTRTWPRASATSAGRTWTPAGGRKPSRCCNGRSKSLRGGRAGTAWKTSST